MTTAQLRIPQYYGEFRDIVRSLHIPELEVREAPTQSVTEYASHEPVPPGFPRPDDHMVIADYLIDLPVVAVDCSFASGEYERVLAYAYGDWWEVADSLSQFADSLRVSDNGALFGRPEQKT